MLKLSFVVFAVVEAQEEGTVRFSSTGKKTETCSAAAMRGAVVRGAVRSSIRTASSVARRQNAGRVFSRTYQNYIMISGTQALERGAESWTGNNERERKTDLRTGQVLSTRDSESESEHTGRE